MTSLMFGYEINHRLALINGIAKCNHFHADANAACTCSKLPDSNIFVVSIRAKRVVNGHRIAARIATRIASYSLCSALGGRQGRIQDFRLGGRKLFPTLQICLPLLFLLPYSPAIGVRGCHPRKILYQI